MLIWVGNYRWILDVKRWLLTTVRHYSPLFATVRHYSPLFALFETIPTIRDYSLFAIRDYSLFTVRVFQTPDTVWFSGARLCSHSRLQDAIIPRIFSFSYVVYVQYAKIKTKHAVELKCLPVWIKRMLQTGTGAAKNNKSRASSKHDVYTRRSLMINLEKHLELSTVLLR